MLIQFSVRFSLQGEFIVDFETRKMSSDSEMSILSETSSRPEEENEGEEDEEVEVIYSRITPYQPRSQGLSLPAPQSERGGGERETLGTRLTPYEDEPLAVVGADEDLRGDEEADVDGLTATVLEARNERQVAVNSWFV